MPSNAGAEAVRVRVCSAQIASVWDDPEKSLQKAGQYVRYAAENGAGLVCFPEQYATGWDPEAGSHVQDIKGPIVTAYQKMAQRFSVTILGSIREEAVPRPRNTAIALSRDGSILASYSKMHLFSPSREDVHFSPGDMPGIFSLGGLSFGIAICYDLRFAALFRIYAKRGVHAVIVPAAWPMERTKHWELFITARAVENQIYIIGVNTTGNTPAGRYAGVSMTVDPYGEIISRATDAEQVLFSDIDPAIVREARRDFPMAEDHRDSLYNALLRVQ